MTLTLTCDLDLRTWRGNGQDKTTRKISMSKVISFKTYCVLLLLHAVFRPSRGTEWTCCCFFDLWTSRGIHQQVCLPPLNIGRVWLTWTPCFCRCMAGEWVRSSLSWFRSCSWFITSQRKRSVCYVELVVWRKWSLTCKMRLYVFWTQLITCSAVVMPVSYAHNAALKLPPK